MFTDRRGRPRSETSPAEAFGPAGARPAARFLFDRDFSVAATDGAERPVPLVEHEAAVATARAAAFQSGYEAGKAAAEAQAAERTAAAAIRLADGVETLLGAADAALARIEGDAVAAAVLAARKLAAHLIAGAPLAEIEALLGDCLAPLRQQPHLVVRLSPDDADALRDRVADLADRHGFAGRLVVRAEAAIPRGDCRIEWADGAIVRSLARADAEIAAAVAARFPRSAAPPPAPIPSSDADA